MHQQSLAASRAQAQHAMPSATSDRLPVWPVAAGFSGFLGWWLLGLGDLIWVPISAVMIHYLLRNGRSRLRLPRYFGLWLIFLLLMLASGLMLDSVGRFIGFTQRALMYLSVTTIFIYSYQPSFRFNFTQLARVLTHFWVLLVVGGGAGLLLPEFVLSTPLAWVLPSGIVNNELVAEMAYRRLTQFNPDSWAQLWPRPSAPFLYSNGWGLAYALLTPIVIAYFPSARPFAKVGLGFLIPLSLIPAGLSLNRGMFVGLGVAGIIVLTWATARRLYRIAGTMLLMLIVAGLILVVLPVTERLNARLETSSTTTDRMLIYTEALERTARSPIIGYGSPRPSLIEGLPSTGTQGQVWMVMFSHGFIAIFIFITVLAALSLASLRRAWATTSLLPITFAAAVANALVGMFYYSLLNTTCIIVVCCGALLVKEHHATLERTDPGS